MPAAARLGDVCTGHDACPPRGSTGGSPDFFINGMAAHRVNDSWGAHGCPIHPPHGSVLASGSSSFFINGKAAGRKGDAVACGGTVASGPGDFFIGG
jgi:uncharacterized Zn-binding protein involved in type VI secretion